MTSRGMELATFWLVAQCLSQLRRHVPLQIYMGDSKLSEILSFSPVSSTLFKTTTELFQFGLRHMLLIRFYELVASSANEI
jgi:hypothetical protein